MLWRRQGDEDRRGAEAKGEEGKGKMWMLGLMLRRERESRSLLFEVRSSSAKAKMSLSSVFQSSEESLNDLFHHVLGRSFTSIDQTRPKLYVRLDGTALEVMQAQAVVGQVVTDYFRSMIPGVMVFDHLITKREVMRRCRAVNATKARLLYSVFTKLEAAGYLCWQQRRTERGHVAVVVISAGAIVHREIQVVACPKGKKKKKGEQADVVAEEAGLDGEWDDLVGVYRSQRQGWYSDRYGHRDGDGVPLDGKGTGHVRKGVAEKTDVFAE